MEGHAAPPVGYYDHAKCIPVKILRLSLDRIVRFGRLNLVGMGSRLSKLVHGAMNFAMVMDRPNEQVGEGRHSDTFLAIFGTLTPKQHDVFALVAENLTSKEIAGQLGVSESAINQRIEAVRGKAGFPPRAQLARAYRLYAAKVEEDLARGTRADPLTLDRAADWKIRMERSAPLADVPSASHPSIWIVPEALSGRHAGLNRLAAMVVIAAGSLMVALVGLGVAQALAAVH